jgi:hypothetical protein
MTAYFKEICTYSVSRRDSVGSFVAAIGGMKGLLALK